MSPGPEPRRLAREQSGETLSSPIGRAEHAAPRDRSSGLELPPGVVRIHGSKAGLERVIVAGDQIGAGVRSFIRKWRATVDEDGQYVYAVAL